MLFQMWVLIVVAMINIALLAIIPWRKINDKSNLYFLLSILFNALWAIGDLLFISADNANVALFGAKLFYIAPMFTATFLVLFSLSFPSGQKIKSHIVAMLMAPPILFTAAIIFKDNLLVNTINVNTSPNAYTVNTLLYVLYFVFFVLYFTASYVILYLKTKRSTGVVKVQTQYVLFAALLSSMLAMVTNLLLPLLGQTQYIWLGPVFTMFYVAMVQVAIVKYRLFDLRLFATRSFVYVLSLTTIGIIYIFSVFFLAKNSFLAQSITTGQLIGYISLTLLAALLYQPIKNYFDKITNQIFYRDNYDPQALLNTINNKIVNVTDLEIMLNDITDIIESSLKIRFCDFYLEPQATIEYHVAGSNKRLFSDKKWSQIEEIMRQSQLDLLNTESAQTPPNVKELLRSLNVELVVRLRTKQEDVGYLIIGEKVSGNAYFERDLKTFKIIADEVSIAVQNSVRYMEISQFTITLQKKIDDATRELQKSNDKLKQLDEAKDEFISMASHQLRTPLTSVKGYLSMMLEGDAGDINDAQRKFLDQAFLSSQRMVYLIADLLNVSRLKTGKFIIEPKPTYLPDVVESEISQLYETAKARDLTLTFSKPESFCTLNLDETKIRQVIMNFVDNAIYYTPKGGRIKLSLKQTRDSVEFTVADSGIGVPKSEQHRLFTKFYRAGNAKKARPDGTGLGLFMAKKVVVAQGGAIIFSTTEGKGSTFGFSFPRTKLESNND